MCHTEFLFVYSIKAAQEKTPNSKSVCSAQGTTEISSKKLAAIPACLNFTSLQANSLSHFSKHICIQAQRSE